jgi:uncharacterized sulfatase
MPWSERTVAERLGEAGYITGMCGKWHLDGAVGSNGEMPDGTTGPRIGPQKAKLPRGRVDNPGHAGHHGFAEHLCGSLRTYVATHDADGKDLGGTTVHVDPGFRIDVQAKWASSFIDRHADGDQPFFLYVPFFAPHVPLEAPDMYLDRFPGEMPRRRRLALAMLSAVDDGVGLISSMLARHGLTDNTLVFYISDNGAPLKIHKVDAPGGGAGWDGSLNDPLLGEKGMLTEGGIRVPFIASWPGHMPKGLVYDRPVIALDAVATALTAAGLPLDDAIDGVDLVPALTERQTADPHDALYWRWVGQAAIRVGDWKYLQGDDRAYLFDVNKDPSEKQNLIATHPERAASLKKKLLAWSQDLVDPGLDAPLSTAGKRYFDHYLDGKLATPPAGSAETAQPAMRKSSTGKASRSSASLFKVRDKNKDGTLTLEEFIGDPANRNVPVLTKRFNGWDTDRDGKVTLKEMQGGN